MEEENKITLKDIDEARENLIMVRDSYWLLMRTFELALEASNGNMKKKMESMYQNLKLSYCTFVATLDNFEVPDQKRNIDNMGIYATLDDKVYDICHNMGLDVQSKVEKDGAYHTFIFVQPGQEEKVDKTITQLEKLGLKRPADSGNPISCDDVLHYTINFS